MYVGAIKPRQIINYDAGIILIDLHQLNVKTTSNNTNQRHWIRGNLMSTKNRTRRTTTHNINFPNQMIEQINIALEQKGSGISRLGHWSLPSEITSEKAYTSIKSDEEWTSRVLPSEQDDIVNSLNYERHCPVIELPGFYFPDIDQTACWLCHRPIVWMISSYGDQSTTRE